MPEAIASEQLLCESCGYAIGGSKPAEPCPECGTPVSESWPSRRVGSAWQRARSPRSWLVTNLGMLLRPGRTLRRIAIKPERTQGLLTLNVAMAGAALAHPVLVLLSYLVEAKGHLVDLPTPPRDSVIASLSLWPVVAAGLYWLTLIESRGLRFFGARRGFRITRDIARVICAHATVGWLIAGLLALGGMRLGEAVLDVSLTRRLGAWRAVAMLAPVWMPLGGFFAGMLGFEYLAWLGMRRCRFANLPLPESDHLDISSPPEPPRAG